MALAGRVALVVLALAVAWRIAAPVEPRIGRPAIAPEVDAVVVRVAVEPARALTLHVEPAGEVARDLASAAASAHAFRLAGLPRGGWVTVRAECDGVRGPALGFPFRTLAPAEATVRAVPAGLSVSVTLSAPAACALGYRTARGAERIEAAAGAPAGFVVPAARMPFARALTLELSAGARASEEPLPWDDAAQRAYLAVAAGWLAGEVERLVAPVLAAPGARDADLAALAALLPPEWFLDEAGGGGGVLDRVDLPPDLRERFDRALRWLELYDAALVERGLPVRYPYHRLYGRAIGPSRATHLGPALGVLLTPERAPDPEAKVLAVACTAELGACRAGRRAELFASVALPEGSAVELRVNGHPAVRLCRPDAGPQPEGGAPLYGGFDAALLGPGRNRFELASVAPPGRADHGVRLDLQGLSVRIKD